MNDFARAPQDLFSNEYDLTEVCRSLWKQKYLILGAVILFGLLAVAYVYFSVRQYQVSSVLRPAPINELDELNRSGVYNLSPSDALSKAGAALESYETRLGFFRKHENLFSEFMVPGQTPEQVFEEFNRTYIALIVPDSKKNDGLNAFVKLDLIYPERVDGVAITNGLIKYAIDNERDEISTSLKVIIDNRLRELNGKLAAARSAYDAEKEAKIAHLLEADALKRAQLQDEVKALRLQLKTERNDRMAQLGEAISIAKTLGIKRPSTPSSMADSTHDGSGSVMRTEVNSQQIPLYFMGTEALEAEYAILQQRKSDDFTEKRIAQIAKELQMLQANREAEVLNQRSNEDVFLRDVEPLRAEIARLRNLNVDVSNIKLVTVDQVAQQPAGPIKPKKALVLLLGLALGFFVGLLVALVRYFIATPLSNKTVYQRVG
ncbi:GNVR domain-containing protein [Pseudomonas sp. 18173]|uniref:GNVR domain-containing protein n=1 Tax=Pseudomonas sp. 18173 TaxID=3390055 RepID=UPI003D1F428D